MRLGHGARPRCSPGGPVRRRAVTRPDPDRLSTRERRPPRGPGVSAQQSICAARPQACRVGGVARGRRPATRDPRPRPKSATRDPRPRATRALSGSQPPAVTLYFLTALSLETSIKLVIGRLRTSLHPSEVNVPPYFFARSIIGWTEAPVSSYAESRSAPPIRRRLGTLYFRPGCC